MTYNLAVDTSKACSFQNYEDTFRNTLYLSHEETIMIYCVVPFVSICIIFNLYFFYNFPRSRQPPFDILLFVTIFSILTTLVYLSTNIYNGIHPPDQSDTLPFSFSSFCQITGALHFISEFGSTTYNAVFCFYYTCKIRNTLKSLNNDHKEVHFLCFVLIIIATIVHKLSDQIGVSALGVCGLKFTRIAINIEVCLFSFYFLSLTVSSVIFLRSLYKISKHERRLKMFFKYFIIYTILLSLLYITRAAIDIIFTVQCQKDNPSFQKQTLAMIGNVVTLIRPVVITIIIFFHPEFEKQVAEKCSHYFSGRRIQPVFMRSTYLDGLIKQKNNQVCIELGEYQKNEKNEQGYLSSFKQVSKLSLLSTILGCISLMSSQRKYRHKSLHQQRVSRYSEQTLFSWNFHDQYEVIVDQEIMKQSSNHFTEQKSKQQYKFIAYSVTVFEQLMAHDNIDHLQKSVNPHSNIQKIKQNIQTDGGKSGQFFLFTHDNKVLLKTITQQELHVLLDKLPEYYKYLKNHPQSFIVRIYGVYTVINPQTQEKYHFMMMINLCQDINKKYLLRVYDCKGSTHQRQVFKQDQIHQQIQYSKKTMKDVDFQRLENKIWINKQIVSDVKERLKSDSQFFCSNGLIDYSLIIIKVNYHIYCSQLKNQPPTFNKRTMYKSEKQPDVVYILGIIDYLETWNVKKRGQRFWKSIFNKKKAISSQKPSYYSKRFCSNLIDKIFE